eukprot:gene488-616_t
MTAANSSKVQKREFFINLKDYEDPSMIKKFDNIRQSLIKSHGDDPSFTNKNLSVSLGQLLQFYDDVLGKNATPRLNHTKLPMKLFKDYSANGSLFQIFSTMHTFKTSQDWKKFDFRATNRKEKNIELLATIESNLLKSGTLIFPQVFISPDVKSNKNLQSIIEQHGGKVVTQVKAATHIIKNSNEEIDEPRDVEYLRTIEHKDKFSLVHWWYYPDSYDAWLPSSEVEGEEPEPDNHTLPWKVSVRWITDTDIFNEWMNEIDYEVDENGNTNGGNSTIASATNTNEESTTEEPAKPTPPPSKKGRGRGRKPNTPTKRKSVKSDGEDDESDSMKDVESTTAESSEENGGAKKSVNTPAVPPLQSAKVAVPIAATGKPLPNLSTPPTTPHKSALPNPSTPQPVQSTPVNKTPAPSTQQNRPRSSSSKSAKMDAALISAPMVVSNISHAPTTPLGTAPPPPVPTTESTESTPSTTTTTTTTTASSTTNPTTTTKSVVLTSNFSIPKNQCSWFKMNEIHEIEKNQMSEFFNGKSPSKTPEIYREYRDFMINTYLQNPYQYLTLTAVRRNLVGDVCSIMRVHSFLEHWGLINYFVNPDGGGYVPLPSPQIQQVPSAGGLSKSTDSTSEQGKVTTTTGTSTTTTKSTTSATKSPLDLRNNIYGQPYKYFCSKCRTDCGTLRYNLTGKPMIDGNPLPDSFYPYHLCVNCFNNGAYDTYLQSSDFTRVEQPVSEQPDEWTDQETLLLLEGLDIFGDSWSEIAEHVGTKTREQCLLHFLRLPIEDSYLEDNISKFTNANASSASSASASVNDSENIFSDINNPVMSLIAFLSSSVSPVVAAAAAKAACDVLSNEYKEKEKDTMDVDKEKEAVGSESEKMDTESTTTTTSTTTTNEQQNEDKISKINLQSAAAAALAAASIKAKTLSKVEEKEIQSLVLRIINVQTKKLEIKLKHYSDLEDTLEKERMILEKSRQNLFAERFSLLKAAQDKALLQQQQQQQFMIAQQNKQPSTITSPPQQQPTPTAEVSNVMSIEQQQQPTPTTTTTTTNTQLSTEPQQQ